VEFQAFFMLLHLNILFLNYMDYVGAQRLEYISQSSTDANVFPLLSHEKYPPIKQLCQKISTPYLQEVA
jgi:hypothetical protein